MRVYTVQPNIPDHWSHEKIRIKDGQRDSDDFVKDAFSSDKISIQDIENDDLLNVLYQNLHLGPETLANTITISENKKYVYQFTYKQMIVDTDEELLKVYNYFASIINNNVETIFGPVVFFKIDKTVNKLCDMERHELMDFLANLYYVKALQVRNGELVEITLPNVYGYVQDTMKEKKKHELAGWEFFLSKDVTADISDLGIEEVDIKSYEGLVILKQKQSDEVSESVIDSLKNTDEYKIDKNTIRGIYQDLDMEFVKKFFRFSL